MNKKIIVLILSLLLLVSCGTDNDKQKSDNNDVIVAKSNIDNNQLENENIEEENIKEDVSKIKDKSLKDKQIEKEKIKALDKKKKIIEEKKEILNYVEGSGYKNITSELKKVNDKYMNTKDFGSCMTRSINQCNNDIITDLMRVEEDKSLCDGFITEQQKNNCKNTFITKEAIEVKSFEKCSESKGGINKVYNCRNEIANIMILETSDVKYCDKIKITEKDLQDETVSKLINKCKNNFIINESVKNSDKSICEKLLDDREKNNCKNNIERLERDKLEKIKRYEEDDA